MTVTREERAPCLVDRPACEAVNLDGRARSVPPWWGDGQGFDPLSSQAALFRNA
jgi:hypothetical protein